MEDEVPAVVRFTTNAVILRAMGNQVSSSSIPRRSRVNANPSFEQIQSLKFLRSLCLANKLFYSEFVVFLYRELDISIEKIDFQCPHLVHTWTFIPISNSIQGDESFNRTVERLLEKMPCLKSFV